MFLQQHLYTVQRARENINEESSDWSPPAQSNPNCSGVQHYFIWKHHTFFHVK
jgi:hypothetical protein